MKPEDFELFLKDVDQFVYNSSSAGKENSFPSNYEHERTLLELLILKYIRKPFKLYLTGLQAIGLAADDDVVDMHIVLGKIFSQFTYFTVIQKVSHCRQELLRKVKRFNCGTRLWHSSLSSKSDGV